MLGHQFLDVPLQISDSVVSQLPLMPPLPLDKLELAMAVVYAPSDTYSMTESQAINVHVCVQIHNLCIIDYEEREYQISRSSRGEQIEL